MRPQSDCGSNAQSGQVAGGPSEWIALEVSPLALKDFGVESARDLLALMLQLEDEFGIAPAEDGASIAVDPKAPAAPKVIQMLKAWGEKRAELAAGEISEEEYREWKSRF